MDRTLISWNVPNMITIPLMAFLGFLILAIVVQLYFRFSGAGGGSNLQTTSGGY